MKPSFALDLNHDGIGLVHRGKGGWQLVGKVALDDPDLGTALATLRDTATALGSGALSTKLIVPGSQILFTSMTAPGPDDVTREARIREGLEGLTPYPVEDLVFDWQSDRDEEAMVHVAVVARETLDEALGFANDHGLNPVGFVARPKGAFSGEVHFGSVEGSGVTLERETRPVPKLLDAAPRTAMSETPDGSEPQTPSDPPLVLEDAESDTPSTNDIPALAPFPPTPDEPATAQAPEPKSRQTRSEKKPEAPKPKAEPPVSAATSDPQTPAKPQEPEIGFSSRRSADVPADLTPEDAHTSPATTPPPDPLPAEPRLSFGLGTTPPDPKADDTAERTIPKAPPTKVHVPVTAPTAFEEDPKPAKPAATKTRSKAKAKETAKATAKATAERSKESLSKAARKGAAGLTVAAERASTLGRQAASKLQAPKSPPEPRADAAQTTGRGKALAGQFLRRGKSKPDTPARSPDVTPIAPPPTPDGAGAQAGQKGRWTQEAESLTVFGARQTQQVGGKPRFLALYLVLGLLVFMAILVIWSMLFLSDGSTARNSENIDQFEAAITTAQSDPQDDTPFGTDSTLVDPALVESDEVSDTQTPEPLSEEAAQARYAATGIWQRAPAPLEDAEPGRIDDLYVASIDPRTEGHDAVALTPLQTGQMGGPPPNTNPPPPVGTVFNLDERGFVEATPEGALTPAGALVFAGRPDVVPAPAPRPEQTQAEADEETPQDADTPEAEIADTAPSVRPRARPEGLVEGNERLLLGGRTRTELARLRPRGRPEAVTAAAQAQAQAQADAIAAALSGENASAAGIAPTALAVARSASPKARPKNFSRIVARARPNGGASDGSVAVAAASPRQTTTPKIPTRASVAKQATIKNAINMRKVSLIGIYGSASSRRALVRMPSGRYVKVGVGSRLDGGKVVSISTTKLIYQKGGRTVTLNILPFS